MLVLYRIHAGCHCIEFFCKLQGQKFLEMSNLLSCRLWINTTFCLRFPLLFSFRLRGDQKHCCLPDPMKHEVLARILHRFPNIFRCFACDHQESVPMPFYSFWNWLSASQRAVSVLRMKIATGIIYRLCGKSIVHEQNLTSVGWYFRRTTKQFLKLVFKYFFPHFKVFYCFHQSFEAFISKLWQDKTYCDREEELAVREGRN